MNTRLCTIFSPAFASSIPSKKETLSFIRPSYSLSGINSEETQFFVTYVEKILHSILPQDVIEVLTTPHYHTSIKKKIASLTSELPLFHINCPTITPCTLNVTVLCPSEYTDGVGRYLSDTFSYWLIPGKFLNISCTQSLNFSFSAYPKQQFFIHQVFLDIHNEDDHLAVKNNWEMLKHEMRLNILSVKHARHIIAIKRLSSEQKTAIIQENIASILERPLKDIDHNAFDQMHHFLLQVTAEEKLSQIQEKFLPAFQQRSKAFQRDIFSELKQFILLFGKRFTVAHNCRYISRLISYQYLFRKSLQRILLSAPSERHLSLKLLKTQLNTSSERKTVLGVFGAMNVLRENEIFEERHLIQAIRHCLPNTRKVENSFILDRRSHDPIRVFYIEIEKKEGKRFSNQDIKELQKHLPCEIEESIESAIHPVFMPRNEEEVMRNIVLLSRQLHYVSDIPQVIISFDTQAEHTLIFTVILLRVLKENTPSLMHFLSACPEFKIKDLEVKKVGLLRKRHVKEANIFKVHLPKKKFLRKDFSIALLNARHELSSKLNTLFNGIRDFNGGILSTQHDAFTALCSLLKNTPQQKDFLLENFFYSLTPPLHQSLIKPSILKELFILTLEAFKEKELRTSVFLKAQTLDDLLLLVVASCDKGLKDALFSIVNTLHIPSSDLSFAQISSYGVHCFSYIYRNPCAVQRHLFYTEISSKFNV